MKEFFERIGLTGLGYLAFIMIMPAFPLWLLCDKLEGIEARIGWHLTQFAFLPLVGLGICGFSYLLTRALLPYLLEVSRWERRLRCARKCRRREEKARRR